MYPKAVSHSPRLNLPLHCAQAHHRAWTTTNQVTLLQGKLRIGLAEQTVLAALAQAVLLQRPENQDNGKGKGSTTAGQLEEASQAVKYVYSQCPSYDQLIPALLTHPISVRPIPQIPCLSHHSLYCQHKQKTMRIEAGMLNNSLQHRAVLHVCSQRPS